MFGLGKSKAEISRLEFEVQLLTSKMQYAETLLRDKQKELERNAITIQQIEEYTDDLVREIERLTSENERYLRDLSRAAKNFPARDDQGRFRKKNA